MHITTSSLSPRVLGIHNLALRDYNVVVSDIDYTLVDIGGAHERGIAAMSIRVGNEIAMEVDAIYHSILSHKRSGDGSQARTERVYETNLESFRGLQGITDGRLPKVWSREYYIMVAARRRGHEITLRQLEQARDAYWREFLEPTAYHDALELILWLQENRAQLILMTASDSVMRIAGDPQACVGAKLTQVVYDPVFSRDYKKSRFAKIGFAYDNMVIGDPHDKPSQEYFDEVERASFRFTAPARMLFIGDSDSSDLAIPRERGFDTVLIERS